MSPENSEMRAFYVAHFATAIPIDVNFLAELQRKNPLG